MRLYNINIPQTHGKCIRTRISMCVMYISLPGLIIEQRTNHTGMRPNLRLIHLIDIAPYNMTTQFDLCNTQRMANDTSLHFIKTLHKTHRFHAHWYPPSSFETSTDDCVCRLCVHDLPKPWTFISAFRIGRISFRYLRHVLSAECIEDCCGCRVFSMCAVLYVAPVLALSNQRNKTN